MHGREQRVLLRDYLEQGLSKSEVADRLGISRRTVYYWINSGQLDRELDDEPIRYRPRPVVSRKVDAFRGVIETRLSEYPKLSAVRLFDEARAAGYDGGYTQVKEFVRQVRPTPAADPVVRFETAPGQQAQVDFAEFRLPWGTRYALVVVLGYSRLLWLRLFVLLSQRTGNTSVRPRNRRRKSATFSSADSLGFSADGGNGLLRAAADAAPGDLRAPEGHLRRAARRFA